MNPLGRLLALTGAVAVAFAAVLPWVTVEGLPSRLDLLGTSLSPLEATVSGTETPAWPVILGAAALAAALAMLNVARRLLVFLGLIVLLAGGGLWYYLDNVIGFETADRSAIEQALADLAVTSEVRLGPYLLLGGGLCIVLSGLLARRCSAAPAEAEPATR